MKIEITMTELMLIIDMIREGKDNEGQDTYTLEELAKAFEHIKENESTKIN